MGLGLDGDGPLEHFERLVLLSVGLEKRRELLVDLEQVPRRQAAQRLGRKLVELESLGAVA